MKLPSIQKIIQDSRSTIGRFPLAFVCAILSTIAALILTDRDGPAQKSVLFNILFSATLGFPLFMTIALVAQKRFWSNLWSYGAQIIAIITLVGYAYSLPIDIPHAPMIYLFRHLILALGLILLTMIAPYSGSGQQNGFWQFNKMLFFRLLTAALFAAVLFIGLSVALAALQNLFGMDVPGKRYAELWFAIVGIFAPLFFLTGIPENLDALDANIDYPKGLRVFAQYILAPLVIVYLIILYAYIAKIVIQWNWPQGWVSRLVLSFSATGIFALALLYPIRELSENRWVKSAIRWFWIVIIPLIIVLVLAIWQRISDYGITEGRYIGVALAIWLAGLSIYFNLSKTKGLKIIPASLCLLALAISFGPWGVFRVSERSQVGRLRELLVKNNLLVDNKLHASSDTLRGDDARQISSMITYLHDTHGYTQIQPWFSENLSIDSADTSGRRKEPELVTSLIGIKYFASPNYNGSNQIEFSSEGQRTLAVDGYQRIIIQQFIRPDARGQKFEADGIAYQVDTSLWVMTFIGALDSTASESLQVDLHPLIDTLIAEYGPGGGEDIPPQKMSVFVAERSFKIEVCIRRIQLQRKNDIFTPVFYSADILYSIDKEGRLESKMGEISMKNNGTYKTGFAEINGANIYYETIGEGQPIVFLHAGIADSRMWTKQVEFFSNHYQVITCDLRGYGKSQMPAGSFAFYRDLKGLLDTLNVANVILVGSSLGGSVAIDFALEYPKAVRALVLVGTAVDGYRFADDSTRKNLKEIDEALQNKDLERAAELEINQWVIGKKRSKAQLDGSILDLVREMLLSHYKNNFDLGEEEGPEEMSINRIADINVPTLIIIGDHDVPDMHTIADILKNNIKNANKIIMPGTAHLPNIEKPTEFNNIIFEFIKNIDI